jgi:hypothetical protein
MYHLYQIPELEPDHIVEASMVCAGILENNGKDTCAGYSGGLLCFQQS